MNQRNIATLIKGVIKNLMIVFYQLSIAIAKVVVIQVG